jgi:hypothetical protein
MVVDVVLEGGKALGVCRRPALQHEAVTYNSYGSEELTGIIEDRGAQNVGS